MRKLQILTLVTLVVLVIGIVYADQMTFSTYYPAPFGVYNQMVVRTLGIGDMNNDSSINHLDAPDPNNLAQANDLWVAGSVGIGTTDSRYELDIEGAPLTTDTVARFGAALPLYIENHWPAIGFNSYWESDAIKLGKASSNNYGADITYDPFSGALHFRLASTPGNEGDVIDLRSNVSMLMRRDGNIGIGTTTPEIKATGSGYVDTQDVWLRDANGGSGGWASEAGGAPVYDSGWFVIDTSYTHTIPLDHDLGYLPTDVRMYVANANPPTWIRPVPLQSQGIGYWAPESTWISDTQILISVQPADTLIYCDGVNPCPPGVSPTQSGYARVLLW